MSSSNRSNILKYKAAGVDIALADKFKEYIKSKVKGIGLFSGMFEIPKGYKEPLLVSSTDSVGTKIKIAIELGIHNTIGEDIVNHCINDILCCGATPLYFLDYIATSKLNLKREKSIIDGIINACKKNNIKLLGGETAELPGFYNPGEYDLVGFITGIVEKSKVITGKKIKIGDKIVGFYSNGLHTNGYSLVRSIIKEKKLSLNMRFGNSTLGEELLKVHKSYKDIILPNISQIKGIAHITGGGFYGNIPRILPKGTGAKINVNWDIPPIFKFIQKEGSVSMDEMFSVFNMGIGMIVITDKPSIFNDGIVIGEIIKGETIKIVY